MSEIQKGGRISSKAVGECEHPTSKKVGMQGMLGSRTSRVSGTAMQTEESQAPREQLRRIANT